MNELLPLLKLALSNELEKQGSNLLEFEAGLEEIEKQGAFDPLSAALGVGGSVAKGFGGLLKGIPELGLTASMMAGTLGGTVAYGAHRYMSDQDKALKDRQDEVNRVKEITQRLRSDYGLA